MLLVLAVASVTSVFAQGETSTNEKESSLRHVSLTGKNQPVYVVDNNVVTLDAIQRLDPEQIRSIVVLKDSAATSLYGSRGYYGAVIIEMKTATVTPTKPKKKE